MAFVVAGDRISSVSSGFMSGHGTAVEEGFVVSCVSGRVSRVNKLISVIPTGGRYLGAVGDLVVGEVVEVGHKSWRLEVGGVRLASLALSSVNLPDDEQRIRTREDALVMRTLFDAGDLVCAEVSKVRPDGTIALHTRSNRYGKLENGEVVKVRAGLVRRLPAHFAKVAEDSVELAIGNNGWIWVQRAIPTEWIDELSRESGGGSSESDALLGADGWKILRSRHALRGYDETQRRRVDRVAASLRVLGKIGATITPDTVDHVYGDSHKFDPKGDMLYHRNAKKLVDSILAKAAQQANVLHTTSSLSRRANNNKRQRRLDDDEQIASDGDEEDPLSSSSSSSEEDENGAAASSSSSEEGY